MSSRYIDIVLYIDMKKRSSLICYRLGPAYIALEDIEDVTSLPLMAYWKLLQYSHKVGNPKNIDVHTSGPL